MPSSENLSEDAWDYVEERFGVGPETMDHLELRKKSGDIWIVPKGLKTDLNIETHGFRFLRVRKFGFKPTTYGLQFLGNRIEDSVYSMTKDEFIDMLNREHLDVEGLSRGYVALEYRNAVIGCGFYKNGVLSSRIPKGRSKELLELL